MRCLHEVYEDVARGAIWGSLQTRVGGTSGARESVRNMAAQHAAF